MSGWRELFPEPPDSALSDVGLLLLQRGLLECCPARQSDNIGMVLEDETQKRVQNCNKFQWTSMKSANI